MTFKQKIVIFGISGLLILAIIGLSIGIILVASVSSVGSSMKVTYTATEVACTISSTAQVYNANGSKSGSIMYSNPKSIEIEPTDSELISTAGTMTFEDEIFIGDNGNGYVVITFSITNDAGNAEHSRPIIAVGEVLSQGTNMTIVLDDSDAEEIIAGETKTITIKMSVIDASIKASFEGSIRISVELLK